MTRRFVPGLMIFMLIAGFMPARPDDDGAKKLLLEAQLVMDRDKEPAAAQRLLDRALSEAVTDLVKGRIILEIAYLSWFRLEPTDRVRELLARAVSLIGAPDGTGRIYPEGFLKLWRKEFRPRRKPGRRRLRADAAWNIMASADNRLANAYGRWHMLPELRLAVRVQSQWFAWVSASMCAFSATLPIVERQVDGSQRFLALGAARELKLGRRTYLFLALGPQMTWIEEKSQLDIAEKSQLGFLVRIDLEWRHHSGFFIFLTAGYGGASLQWSERDVRSGGARVGGGLGMSL